MNIAEIKIEKKVRHDLKAAGEVAIAAKTRSDIDAEVTKFKAGSGPAVREGQESADRVANHVRERKQITRRQRAQWPQARISGPSKKMVR